MIFHCFSLFPAILDSGHTDRSFHIFSCYGDAG